MDALFSIGLLKAYLSSPLAAQASLGRRLRENQRQLDSDAEHSERTAPADWPAKWRFCRKACSCWMKSWWRTPCRRTPSCARYSLCLKQLKWKGTKASKRIVLFAERIETLEYLDGRSPGIFWIDDAWYRRRSGAQHHGGHCAF